jgi:pimeloyl-ACP methyl ester carboxylesterase
MRGVRPGPGGEFMSAVQRLLLLVVLLSSGGGCTWVSYLGTDPTGEQLGKTFYLGGAGTLGHVGTLEVPRGLRQGGYRGSTEVIGWQSWIPSTLRDQIDVIKNRSEAQRFARRIRDYLDRYPDRRVNIIALSAGTGITTWALEELDPRYRIGTVIYLSSSLSREYDLSAALRRIDGRLYNFHSTKDPVLRFGVPLAGTVDREYEGPGVAGLQGFAPPPGASEETRALYRERVRNRPWRQQYARFGYRGQHTDSTSVEFVEHVLTPLIEEELEPQPGAPAAAHAPSSAAGIRRPAERDGPSEF